MKFCSAVLEMNRISWNFQDLFTTWCHIAPPLLNFNPHDFGVSQSKTMTLPYKTWGSGGIILWAMLTVFLVLETLIKVSELCQCNLHLKRHMMMTPVAAAWIPLIMQFSSCLTTKACLYTTYWYWWSYLFRNANVDTPHIIIKTVVHVFFNKLLI